MAGSDALPASDDSEDSASVCLDYCNALFHRRELGTRVRRVSLEPTARGVRKVNREDSDRLHHLARYASSIISPAFMWRLYVTIRQGLFVWRLYSISGKSDLEVSELRLIWVFLGWCYINVQVPCTYT